jgi:hypothetical protein
MTCDDVATDEYVRDGVEFTPVDEEVRVRLDIEE